MLKPLAPASFLDLIHHDAMEVLPAIPNASVDLIAADLPYAVTALPWDKRLPMEAMWAEFRRILTPTGAIVLTAQNPFSADLITAGRDWFKYSMIWKKAPCGHNHAHSRPLIEHEDVLVFSPGSTTSPSRNGLGRRMTYNAQGVECDGDKPRHQRMPRAYGRKVGARPGEMYASRRNLPRTILEFQRDARPFHACQKPLALMEWIIATYSNPGDLVLDPTMGSGTTGVAARKLARDFIGIEADETFFEHARARINAVD